ncbi:subtilisin-like protease SBT3.9 [Morus notabilis]|nr:subtilisin-like protease SBT3.9 [Morus notabilis]
MSFPTQMKDNHTALLLVFMSLLISLVNIENYLLTAVDAKSNVYIIHMGKKQREDAKLLKKTHHEVLAKVLGSKEESARAMVYSYKHGFSGFAAKMTESQAQKISELPGVALVIPNELYKVQTTRSWDYLQLSSRYQTHFLQKSKLGEDVIIGLFDTGIWPESEAFSDKAGSSVADRSYNGLGVGTVRGGATQARIAMYKVCWSVFGGGLCAGADILKAFDVSVRDGVEVVSVSIAADVPSYPEADQRNAIAVGAFHAVAKGVAVVCAAGNSGPSPQTVQNTSPWILTVGASSDDRSFPTRVKLGNNWTIAGQAMFTGSDTGFIKLAYPEVSDLKYPCDCKSLTEEDTWAKKTVVLCFTTAFREGSVEESASSIRKAGALGLIVAENPTRSLYVCDDDFPCVQVSYDIGMKILYYIRSSRSPKVRISPTKTHDGRPVSTKLAYFSSRGPSYVAPGVLKPDIAAPGVNILSAVSPSDPKANSAFAFMSGTSMAAPHVSGIVALLKSLHPDWSPAAIKSAIVTTAWNTDPSGELIFAEGEPMKLADPFDFGGGIVNFNRAADPGLVYDMGTEDYLHYLCAMGYNNSAISQLREHPTSCPTKRPSVLDLNLPSITIPSLTKPTKLTRTVRNVGHANSSYKAVVKPPQGIRISVRPRLLTFNATNNTISFTVAVSSTHRVTTGYYFGSLTWTDGVHTVNSPISVRTEIPILS